MAVAPLSHSDRRQVVHTRASVHDAAETGTGQGQWRSEAGKVTAGLAGNIMAACCRVYDERHMRPSVCLGY